MIYIVIIIEILCIIPLTILWVKSKNGENMININATFLIIASIINWITYGSGIIGLTITPTSGFFGENINLLGLILSVILPITIITLSWVGYKLFINIRYEILNKKIEKK